MHLALNWFSMRNMIFASWHAIILAGWTVTLTIRDQEHGVRWFPWLQRWLSASRWRWTSYKKHLQQKVRPQNLFLWTIRLRRFPERWATINVTVLCRYSTRALRLMTNAWEDGYFTPSLSLQVAKNFCMTPERILKWFFFRLEGVKFMNSEDV